MKNILNFTLPQIHAEKKPAAGCIAPDDHQQLLVTGGRAPSPVYLQDLQQRGFAQIWAADHGIDACLAAGLQPDRLIGDNDSATPAGWQQAGASGMKVEKYPRAKDYTDTQLALQHAADSGASSIVVTGALGGRFDHAWSNMQSAAHAPVPCCLTDERETVFFLQDDAVCTLELAQPPLALSLLPLTNRCEGVSLSPARWPLDDATLLAAAANAVSNEIGTQATISLRRGTLAVYLCW